MTKSLCPICFKPLDAEVFDEDGKILIKKTCDEHGEFVNTYWSDDKLYNRVKQFEPTITSVENPSVEKFGDCPNNCGLCEDHETSNVRFVLQMRLFPDVCMNLHRMKLGKC